MTPLACHASLQFCEPGGGLHPSIQEIFYIKYVALSLLFKLPNRRSSKIFKRYGLYKNRQFKVIRHQYCKGHCNISERFSFAFSFRNAGFHDWCTLNILIACY